MRGGRPTRIDGLLVDTRLAALLRGSQVLPACGIPHHRPVRFDLLAEGAVQSVVKLERLPRVVIPPLPEEERIPLVQSLLDPLGPRWHPGTWTACGQRGPRRRRRRCWRSQSHSSGRTRSYPRLPLITRGAGAQCGC